MFLNLRENVYTVTYNYKQQFLLIYNKKQTRIFIKKCSLKWYYVWYLYVYWEFNLIINNNWESKRHFVSLTEKNFQRTNWDVTFRSGSLFARLTHDRVYGNIWSYAAISCDLFFFRDESGAAICIRKNSATLWTGKSSDEIGDVEINGRRSHSIFPIFRREISLDYSWSPPSGSRLCI